MLTSLVFPVALMGIALSQLPNHVTALTEGFFASTLAEQAAVMVFLFGAVFALLSTALSMAQNGDASTATTSTTTTAVRYYANTNRTPVAPSAYPLEAIEAATNDKEKFQCLYPLLREEMLTHMRENNEMQSEALEWCREMMDYTVPGGKLNRGTTVVAVYRALLGRPLSALETAQAAVLGWAIEFLQAFFLVADDVMDDSQTRRGQPCWYKLPKVKLIAINDSFLLESYVFAILKKHFGQEPYYPQLLDLMLDVTQKTEFGQLLDLTSQPADGKIDLNRFTLERYKSIVKYKTAFYTFYLPIAMGLIISGLTDEASYELAQTICCQMGEYFQIQDDYLDCYGDPAVIGKVGTDIQDNKCSWLVVQALERVTPAQRKVLEENYGVWDDKKVAKVKALFKELKLEEAFHAYEEESYKAIQVELDKVTKMPRDVFEILLKKIYKRSK